MNGNPLFADLSQREQNRNRARISEGQKSAQSEIACSGFVYVIGDPGGDTFKIGRSRTPKARLSNLRTSSTGTLKILFSLATCDPAAVERAAHELLRDCRVRGEWYRAESPLVAELAVRSAAGDVAASAALVLARTYLSLDYERDRAAWKALKDPTIIDLESLIPGSSERLSAYAAWHYRHILPAHREVAS